ncbi:DUF1987 domain-containing protein [Burkholderiaceae bacterium DAT-1]|nr:DUF1987 domain-containing protein [Burkholderiaceae bacterium DAT-1]
MDNLFIAATASTPEIDFRFSDHTLTMKGESYPENAVSFYGNVLNAVREYLKHCNDTDITLNMALAYCNSSSTKLLFSMLETFSHAVKAGNRVTLYWYHEEEDDTLYDFGQEIHEDYPDLTFVDKPVESH